jgi:hypothetical protein
MLDLIMAVGGLAVTGIFGLIGWVFTMIFSKIDAHGKNHNELETRFDNHRLYVAETYTTKKDIKDMKDEIISQLVRIENKVNKQ